VADVGLKCDLIRVLSVCISGRELVWHSLAILCGVITVITVCEEKEDGGESPKHPPRYSQQFDPRGYVPFPLAPVYNLVSRVKLILTVHPKSVMRVRGI
jgi:hypothetical protein